MSTIVSGMPWISICDGTASRVVPAIGVTIATASPDSRLRRLDLPTLGRPTRTTAIPSRKSAPCFARACTPATCAAIARNPAAHVGGAHELDVLFRKIERGLDEHPQLDQRVGERPDLARERAGQAAGRRARGRRGRGVDQIRDALGLREIELPVEKRALRELSRPGEPRPELDAASEQQAHDRGTAVAVELEHLLAGVRPRRRKMERKALVERFAVGAEECSAHGDAGRERLAHDAGDDRPDAAARHADHADAATPGRRGDRRDRVRRGLRHRGVMAAL